MGVRRKQPCGPGLERLEPRIALSASLVSSTRGPAVDGRQATELASRLVTAQAHAAPAMVEGLVLSRITNPKNPASVALVPPFLKRVLVQSIQPVPGQQYNIAFISVFNGTRRAFTAADGLSVRLTNQKPGHSYPILTGDERWEPGQTIIVYTVTKKSYTDLFSPPTSAGFQFNLAPFAIHAIPGPSGFFQRLTYKPATFPRVLDSIVAYGPGSRGHRLGLPDTSLWQIVPIREADIL